MIERSKRFTIGKKLFVVEFPNVGQILRIESMKQALTDNRYGVMAKSNIKSMYYALDVVDAVSFLSVVVPEVGRYFDVENYLTLSPEKVQEFVDVYQKEIFPWYSQTLDELKNPLSDESSEKTAES